MIDKTKDIFEGIKETVLFIVGGIYYYEIEPRIQKWKKKRVKR